MRLLPVIEEDLKQYEEEEVLYIDGGFPISREEDNLFYEPIYINDRRIDPPMISLEYILARRMAVIKSMPHHYQEEDVDDGTLVFLFISIMMLYMIFQV